MAKYGVYPNPDGGGYLLDVQSDLLDGLNTRVVVPLLSLDEAFIPAKNLNPIFEVDGQRVVMAPQFMAAVPATLLQQPVTDLSRYFTEITNALDMVFQGF